MMAVALGRCGIQGGSRVSPFAIAASVGDVVRVVSRAIAAAECLTQLDHSPLLRTAHKYQCLFSYRAKS